MRYIVIGGSGFVGVYTIFALQEAMQTGRLKQGEILCLDLIPNETLTKQGFCTFVACDISKTIEFEFLQDDIVIALAARAYAPPPPKNIDLESYFMEVNFYGTQKIIQKMLSNNCTHLVYFSTDMVYGKPQYLPIDSSHPRNPFGWYGKSKVESENLIFAYRQKGLKATIFRPRIIVGAGRFGILTKLFKLIDSNLPVPLIGNGKNCYQMISVLDCAQAIICACAKNCPNCEFNLGSKSPPPIKVLLNTLIHNAHSKSLLIPTYAKAIKGILGFLEMCGVHLMYKEQYKIADEEYIVDISNAKEILGWEPKYSDEDMLFSAYKEYKKLKTL
ncbi:NAD-dependent epimerase/dehydratase family protein [Helicobacter fennelliae]|uniref:UDP-glucose 4-epimerase n=1 Tax=Helicobacter fennelliae MRY12-0050 TaxID=1325130 RepID=T1CMS3_9HELI|nr:NAD(P)-dependent oxidoreductase [Helicobacter fennelliae]GAD18069.1 UDP-glucose 4-epimerase [Helicobacter fennelliae MRY12-0050]STP06668.1 NAD-dependent epimerase/dehydratase [Helicobacter fennelliae]